MATWLAYLKSRLLLPVVEDGEETSAEELAARLVFRLQRLEAMRDCATQLMARDFEEDLLFHASENLQAVIG